MLTIEVNEPKVTRQWRTTTRQLHYPHDKPANTAWHSNGQKACEGYYLNSHYHRDNDKPAASHWNNNGQRYYELYHLNGTQYTPRDPTC